MHVSRTPTRYQFKKTEDDFLRRIHGHAARLKAQKGGAARRAMARKALILLSALILSYGALLASTGGWDSLALAILAALIATLITINVGHDAAHDVAARDRRTNWILQFFAFGLLGVSGALWRVRHVRDHHMYTNLHGADSDIEASDWLRFTPHHDWRWYHRAQPVYAPLLYGLVLPLRVWWMDLRSLKDARAEDPETWRKPQVLWEFAATKLFHLTLSALPLAVLPIGPWQWLLGYVLAYSAASMVLTVILVGTHIHDEAAFPAGDSDNVLDTDWSRHIVSTSCDWAPDSRVAAWLFGGLNAHTAHHLMPRLIHGLYVDLSPIIAAEAARDGMVYHRMTLTEMLMGHYRHLVAMGRRPGLQEQGASATTPA